LIPLKDYNPTTKPPIITVVFIIINILVQVIRNLGGSYYFQSTTASFGAIPYEIMHGVDIEPLINHPVYYNLVTSMFMHAGWEHLLGNMLFLWVFGNNIEDYLGHIRFFIFYILGGIVAAYSHILTDPSSTIPMVGASGAISAVMGAYILLYPAARVKTLIWVVFYITLVDLPAFVVLGLWIGYQVLLGMTDIGRSGGGTAWFAHIGGFIYGLLYMSLFRATHKNRLRDTNDLNNYYDRNR
jgi:membrane associated rhomboid family serine protease